MTLNEKIGNFFLLTNIYEKQFSKKKDAKKFYEEIFENKKKLDINPILDREHDRSNKHFQ